MTTVFLNCLSSDILNMTPFRNWTCFHAQIKKWRVINSDGPTTKGESQSLDTISWGHYKQL
jgi:hypothetical protein